MIEMNVMTQATTIGRRNQKSLDGKVAFVTGATGILGTEVAKEFARRGARLILQYHSRVRKALELELALKMMGADVVVVQADYANGLDVKNLVHTVNSHVDSIDYLVHAAGICKNSPALTLLPTTDTAPESDPNARNRINQIAPIELTLGLEEKHAKCTVILYVGSAFEDYLWDGADLFGESKTGLHHFAARYADAVNRRGIRSIYYLPGVLHEEGKKNVCGIPKQEVLLKLGQPELLHPTRVARNIVSSVANEDVFGVADVYEGSMLVRRDGYRI